MTHNNQHTPLAWLGTRVCRGIGVTVAVLGLALSPLNSRIAAAQQISPLITTAAARLPLSAIGRPIYAGQGFLTAILGHVIMIGLPIAWFVTRGVRVAMGQRGTSPG